MDYSCLGPAVERARDEAERSGRPAMNSGVFSPFGKPFRPSGAVDLERSSKRPAMNGRITQGQQAEHKEEAASRWARIKSNVSHIQGGEISAP